MRSRTPVFAVLLSALGVAQGTASSEENVVNEPRANAYVAAVESLLSARTVDDALRLFAPDYRLYFYDDEGEGIARDGVAAMLQWEHALNPRRYDRALAVERNLLTGRVYEGNDFTRLIGFPGWEGRISFWFDDEGRIQSSSTSP